MEIYDSDFFDPRVRTRTRVSLRSQRSDRAHRTERTRTEADPGSC